MKTFTVEKPQTLRDIAIQVYGSWQYVFNLANENGFAIDDGLPMLTVLEYDETIGDKRTRDKLSEKGANVINPVAVLTSDIALGFLYNGYAVNDAKFAPTDWKVPTFAEFLVLIDFAGVDSGSKLKEAGFEYWDLNNTGTDLYNFAVRGSGERASFGVFSSLKTHGRYRTSDDGLWEFASSSPGVVGIGGIDQGVGYSIRLLWDGTGIPPAQTTDLDGNTYDVLHIGSQYWLKQNYACTKLNDGTSIANVTDNTEWGNLITGAYCAYDNDNSNVFI